MKERDLVASGQRKKSAAKKMKIKAKPTNISENKKVKNVL